MLDKNGLPLQFPASAFSGFPLPGFDPRTAPWPHHQPYPTAPQHGLSQSGGPGMGLGDAGAAALLGLPPPHPLSPNYLNALRHHTSPSHSLRLGERLPTHQDYFNAAAQRLGELQANAALQASAAAAAVSDPMNPLDSSRLASLNRANRKRALSASPYPELDLSALVRYSPTSLHFIGGSPGSSGSYGHLSTGTLSPALVHSAHLQQLHAHLLRSAAASPFLSPQNSLQNSLLQLSAAAALHQAPASSGPTYLPLVGVPNSLPLEQSHTTLLVDKTDSLSPFSKDCKESPRPKELCSNVVSSTMKDEESKDDLTGSKMEFTSDQSNLLQSKTPFSVRPEHHSSSMKDIDVKDEPDFIETHCHWIGCDREFGTQDELVRHLSSDHIGSNKKSFVCQWKDCCREEKPFKAQYMLVVHMRRHTGEKPHRCSFENCNKAYSRLENLKTHLRSHTGEKPYSCEFPGCSKAFSNASDRAKHQNRTHSNEKPYACRAPGCTKRYTDPSSLRKHVKTVHGAEFYANKRHKGMNNPDERSEDGPSWCQLNTPRTPHSVSTTKSDAANSPSPSSPPEDRGSIAPQGSNVPTTGARRQRASQSGYQPLSDTDVSTTHHEMLPGWNGERIDMPVVASVGIGINGDDIDCGPPHSIQNPSQRMALKMKADLARHENIGEINRSIEKMSLGGTKGSGRTGSTAMETCPSSSYNNRGMCHGNIGGGQTVLTQGMAAPNSTTARRDSNWTNSTEGYGSMRSEQSIVSRRCSDVSAMSAMSVGSNISMRAQMNSPWDPISADSSRRSSLVGHDASVVNNTNQTSLSHHLNKLHRKSQHLQQQQTCSPTPPQYHKHLAPLPMNQSMAQPSQTRRASDPVRVLDRNFGVGGGNQLTRNQRSGSYNQLNSDGSNPMQQRVPIHGQRIRGMSSESSEQTYFQPNTLAQPTSFNLPNGNSQPGNFQQQQQHYVQQNGHVPQQFNQQGIWPQQQQQQQQQQQGNYDESRFYYNGTNGSGVQFGNNQYPSPATSGNPDWNTQNWNSWQTHSQPQQPNGGGGMMQQQPLPQPMPLNAPTNSANGAKHCDSFQRTFDYVQQCQGWNGQQ